MDENYLSLVVFELKSVLNVQISAKIIPFQQCLIRGKKNARLQNFPEESAAPPYIPVPWRSMLETRIPCFGIANIRVCNPIPHYTDTHPPTLTHTPTYRHTHTHLDACSRSFQESAKHTLSHVQKYKKKRGNEEVLIFFNPVHPLWKV